MRPFDAKSLGLTIDAFSGSALGVDGMVERPIAIEGHAHLPTQFAVDIFDTATALGKLGMVTRVSRALWKEQWATEALSAEALGVVELEGGLHAKLFGTAWGAISIALVDGMGVLIEGHGPDALMQSGALVDIPGIESGIGGDVGGIGV